MFHLCIWNARIYTSIVQEVYILKYYIYKGNETVQDVAKRLGVDVEEVDPSQCSAAVVSGAELLEMSTPELDEVLR